MRLSGSPLSTQKTYLRPVRDLMEYYDSVPEQLSTDQIKAYLSTLRGRLSSSALNLRVCGIKYYFKHVVKRPDLAVDIPNPRLAKYVQEVLSEGELSQLFCACTSMRERAMLHLLYDCGLRSREVCYIKLTDFDKIHRKLTLRNSKGGKLRTVPYSETLRTTLAQYFKTMKTPPSVFLFENKEVAGQGISIRGVQYIVKEVLKRSRLKKEVHPHTFRHSFAVHYIDNGGSILRLKELLGHEDISTTLHYLKFCKIPLQEIPTPLEVMLKRNKMVSKG
jgi:integrase/recombinase XerD